MFDVQLWQVVVLLMGLALFAAVILGVVLVSRRVAGGRGDVAELTAQRDAAERRAADLQAHVDRLESRLDRRAAVEADQAEFDRRLGD